MRLQPLYALLAVAAPAQQGGPRPPSPILRALDSNHDGVISAEEIQNAPAALRTLDANNDGRLTADEIAPAPDGSEDIVGMLMAFDKNQDGKITKSDSPNGCSRWLIGAIPITTDRST